MLARHVTSCRVCRYSAQPDLIGVGHYVQSFQSQSSVCGDTDSYIIQAVYQGRSRPTCCNCGADRVRSILQSL
ncbi:hypothetical protein J6590_068160 [Homalodisca vitripennis]|nr:hypothetical protein J6590_068160 [Homalodisca vitripennis]